MFGTRTSWLCLKYEEPSYERKALTKRADIYFLSKKRGQTGEKIGDCGRQGGDGCGCCRCCSVTLRARLCYRLGSLAMASKTYITESSFKGIKQLVVHQQNLVQTIKIPAPCLKLHLNGNSILVRFSSLVGFRFSTYREEDPSGDMGVCARCRRGKVCSLLIEKH